MSINYKECLSKLDEQYEEMQFAVDEFSEKETKEQQKEVIKEIGKTQRLLSDLKIKIKNKFLGR